MDSEELADLAAEACDDRKAKNIQLSSKFKIKSINNINADYVDIQDQRNIFNIKKTNNKYVLQGSSFNGDSLLENILGPIQDLLGAIAKPFNILGDAINASQKLAEKLDAAVCCNYQHNDAFPGSHPLFAGPLGYNGSKAGMELIKQADVVLALGTRLNPFSTLPCYGIDYWPQDAKLIQVDINPDRIGLTKPVTVGIVGDAKQVVDNILSKLSWFLIRSSFEKYNSLDIKSFLFIRVANFSHIDCIDADKETYFLSFVL